jgi:hypothetical protein
MDLDLENLSDELNRAVKLSIDSGESASVSEAYALFRTYRLSVFSGPSIARSATLQAALLTIVNTGRRCMLGGVSVAGPTDADLLVPWRHCRTLGEAIVDLGGTIVNEVTDGPLVVIGDADLKEGLLVGRPFAVRATFQGWCGGVLPLASDRRLGETQECVPAGILAGSLAVSEAFQHVRGGNAMAGRREVGLSLWQPESEVSWLAPDVTGPELAFLPAKLWLIGLGHLGQAFLWTIGLLPYAEPGSVELVLQDFDSLVLANDSTSPLTTHLLVGRKKTRAMAKWAEERGFRTTVIEREFAANFCVGPTEPSLALCGVDNPQARADLEKVGFRRVIEAGLGKGPTEYLAFAIHTFPGPWQASERWAPGATGMDGPSDELIDQAGYRSLTAEGLDDCGLTLLAGRAVGASFVGVAVSTLVISEVLRILVGGPQYGGIDGSLRSLLHRTTVSTPTPAEVGWNPGYSL